MTTRILQLSDLHVVAPPARVAGRLDTAANLREAVDRLLARELPRLAPLAALLVTGDLSDDGSAESYRIVRGELERLGLPILAIPGNHDRRETFRAAFPGPPGSTPGHRIDWAADAGEIRIVGLDSLVESEAGGALATESLDFLADAVEGAGARPVLVAVHHPPFATGIAFMDRIGLRAPEALAAVLARARGPVRIVAGHVHGAIVGTLGGQVAVTAPGVASAFPADYRPEAPAGFFAGPRGFMAHGWEEGEGFRSACGSLEEHAGPYPF